MKVYIAAPYAARQYVYDAFVLLAERGHECISTWATGTRNITPEMLGASPGTSLYKLEEHVRGDLADVDRAEAVIQLTAGFCLEFAGVDVSQNLHSGGRHVELGYALARGKTLIVVGEDENVFQRGLCMTAGDLGEALELL